MPIDRRSFLTAAAAVAFDDVPLLAATAADPLGVRSDFPVTANRAYLNSAFIAPVHRAVFAAIRAAHTEAKSTGTLNLGTMLGSLDVVRAQFARMINADRKSVV